MAVSGLFYAVAAAVTWGLVYTLDQKILTTASPVMLVFMNSAITTLLMLPIVILRPHPVASIADTPPKVWLLIVMSLSLAALANYSIFSSIRILGASTASVFEIAYPFFVVLFSYFAFRAMPSAYFLFGAILMFAGAAVILLSN